MKHRLALVALLVAVVTGCSSGDPVVAEPVERVFVVSVPGVSWADVRSGTMPTLRSFATDAAVGNLATRVGRREATLAGAYLTMGAGTRALAQPDGAGVALEPSEPYHAERAADVLRRRLGTDVDGLAYLAIGVARDVNGRSPFGAEVGALGDALATAGVHRAVVANGDVLEGRVDDDAYGRSAAAMLMTSTGTLDGGAVDRSLLGEDRSSPFGVALDLDLVMTAVGREAAEGRAVVLVEASDLSRAVTYERATSSRRRAMRTDALRAADELLARTLELAGPDDAVLVLSPVAPSGAPDLGVVALRAPDGDAGLLRSATTRRDGYVQLADVGPTILQLLDVPGMADVEGRPFRVAARGERGLVAELASAGELADFRDSIVPTTVTVLIVALVAIAALAAGRRWLPPGVARAVPVLAAGMLGVLPATFLSASLGVAEPAAYAALLVVGGALVAAAAFAVDRARPGTMPIVSVGVVLAVIAVDVLLGAPLQLNTVFGYSVAVAGRFAGVGNLAFALLGASALVFAALVAERYGRRGRRAAIAVLVAVLLVDGLPVLGADVGGVLSIVPSFGLAVLVLLGRRIRAVHVIGLLGAAFVALVLVAFVDLARPEADQTHLARLADHILDRRWEPFFDSLTRRWSASFGSGSTGAWVVLILLAAAVLAFLLHRTVGTRFRSAPLQPPTRAALVGLLVLATTGLVANDSSFAVPFTMLLVAAPAVLQRLEVAS